MPRSLVVKITRPLWLLLMTGLLMSVGARQGTRASEPPAAFAPQKPLTTKSAPYTDLREYGISGAGSRTVNQHDALQAAINATPDGGEIRCPAGTSIWTSQIDVIQRSSIRFTAAGNGYIGGSCNLYVFTNNGTVDNTTLINLDSSYDVSFDGWALNGNDGYYRGVGARYVVDINKRTTGAAGHGLNSSHHTFRNGVINLGTTKSDAIGVILGNDSYGTNSEFMHFENMNFIGWESGPKYPGMTYYGTGVKILTANTKGITFDRVSFNQLHIGISNVAGSYKVRNARSGAMDIAYYGAGGEGTIIEGDNYETVCQVLVVPPGSSGEWRFMGGRYGATAQNGADCGSASKPSFDFRGSGVLEMDYPAYDGKYLAKSEDGNGAFILHGGTAMYGLPAGLTTFRTVTWFSSDMGEVVAGHQNSVGYIPGFHLGQPSGSLAYGLSVCGAAQVADGLMQCAPGARVVGEGELELGAISNPQIWYSVNGAPGTQHMLLRVYARDPGGNRSLASNELNITNAANSLSPSNYVTVFLASGAPSGAASYDVVCHSGAGYGLIASGVALPYKITANPKCSGYKPPSYNETAGLSVRAPRGLALLNGSPLRCYSDGGLTTDACQFAGGVSAPRISGITDSAVVKNLNAEKWGGKTALDFAADLDFGSIPNQACAERNVQVPGALAANAVAPAWPATLDGGVLGTMFIASPGVVKVRVCNLSGSAHAVRGTFGGRVMK